MGTRAATVTTSDLLHALAEAGNRHAWDAFDQRFRPIIVGLARRRGLSDSEAADAAQETLTEFARLYPLGRYDRQKGRLSSWLIGIAVKCIARMLERRGREAARGDSAFGSLADQGSLARELESDWRAEQQRVVLAQALVALKTNSRLDARTILAFELTAIRNAPAEHAAAECAMSVGEVYVARNRAIKKLRELVADLTAAYESDG